MLIRLPITDRGRPAITGASRIEILRSRVRWQIGRWLRILRVPGVIQNMKLEDKATGQKVAVEIGDLFVRLSVNGRDYYFDRLTGHFDGTGMGCS